MQNDKAKTEGDQFPTKGQSLLSSILSGWKLRRKDKKGEKSLIDDAAETGESQTKVASLSDSDEDDGGDQDVKVEVRDDDAIDGNQQLDVIQSRFGPASKLFLQLH
jgi:hypothetical protein